MGDRGSYVGESAGGKDAMTLATSKLKSAFAP
jgi:hypothetical protein